MREFSQAEIKAHIQKWVKIFKSTQAIDRSRIRANVDLLYSSAGFNPPKEIIILDSPKALALAIENIPEKNIWYQILDQILGQIEDQIWNQTWNQIRDQIRDQIGDQIWGQIWGQIWDQIWDQIGGQIWGQIWDQIYYPTIYSILEEPKFAGIEAMAKNAGAYIPYKDKIFISERPEELFYKKDKCVFIGFRDGFEISKLSPLERLANA